MHGVSEVQYILRAGLSHLRHVTLGQSLSDLQNMSHMAEHRVTKACS
jgi:hypothetical protein